MHFHPAPVRYVVALVLCMFVPFFGLLCSFLYFVAVFLSLLVTLHGFFVRFFLWRFRVSFQLSRFFYFLI